MNRKPMTKEQVAYLIILVLFFGLGAYAGYIEALDQVRDESLKVINLCIEVLHKCEMRLVG